MKKDQPGFFSRLRQGLNKTHTALAEKLAKAATLRMKLDETALLELEEALITSDVGIPTTTVIIESLKTALKEKAVTKPGEVGIFLQREIESLLKTDAPPVKWGSPHLILMVGVNGSGKTTTVGKLAHYYKNEGKSVLLAASDTFRAAAIDQLAEWGKRIGCDIVRHQPGSDPSAVAFDAIKAGIARKRDVIIVDTAGRLHTRVNLMEEMKKIKRVIGRELEGAPNETLLVLDGTTGQNMINQVKEFNKLLSLTGIVITKLDGTSKGGAVVGIVNETGIPIKYLGIGEKIDDLQPFDPRLFAEAII